MAKTQAEYAADWYAKYGNDVYAGTQYADGMILYLTVGEDTGKQWIEALAREDIRVEHARSDDGMVLAFIVRGNPDLIGIQLSIIGESTHKDWKQYARLKDNRWNDLDTIDSFLELVTDIANRGD